MTIRLHHGALSRSVRIRWLLEEMGLEYEIIPVTSIEEHHTEAFLAKNPLGLLPVLEDGDRVVFESGAIIEYLLETYGDHGLRPAKGTAEWIRYQEWLHAAETVIQPLGHILVNTIDRPGFEPPGGVQYPDLAAAWQPTHDRYMNALEGELSDRDYIASDTFSGADIMLAYFVVGAQMFGQLDAEKYPRLAAYAARLASRPAAQKAFSS